LVVPSEDDDGEGSVAFELNSSALRAYLVVQDAGELREPRLPLPPWPALDNPMLKYLIERAIEMSATEPIEVVFGWLSSHAWFEGSIEGRLAERRGMP
jgi:hypothetical protein